jgi:hypothetical protein
MAPIKTKRSQFDLLHVRITVFPPSDLGFEAQKDMPKKTCRKTRKPEKYESLVFLSQTNPAA